MAVLVQLMLITRIYGAMWATQSALVETLCDSIAAKVGASIYAAMVVAVVLVALTCLNHSMMRWVFDFEVTICLLV